MRKLAGTLLLMVLATSTLAAQPDFKGLVATTRDTSASVQARAAAWREIGDIYKGVGNLDRAGKAYRWAQYYEAQLGRQSNTQVNETGNNIEIGLPELKESDIVKVEAAEETGPGNYGPGDLAWRSGLVPGWGQWASGSKTRAAVFGGATYASIGMTIRALGQWTSADQAYGQVVAEETLKPKGTHDQRRIQNAFLDANKAAEVLTIMTCTSVLFYAINVWDAARLGKSKTFKKIYGEGLQLMPQMDGVKMAFRKTF